MKTARVTLTPAAEAIIAQLKEQHGPLMFHQSGGCCDGSSPMCFAEGEFLIGPEDVLLGRIAGCDFWMAKDQFAYWQHTQLTVDVTPGRGASFSLEIPLGVRFLLKSRLFREEELPELEALRFGQM
ncbi:DUF779 domain-containing protein [Cesiribacter andamanensis]|uniref:UDP-glucose 4-epimerase n=1 Tax=Cesiribacter andamanensis AMV16 TaxID=1279009 RepID=M7N810_9BACT|nr:DUF779 domain-containing protein [Cesiribacter andamanensis]EMR04733.1 hypothetical protein ADICEAN_00004 [Cesiribacter andamanensis AMV16]